MDSQSKIRQVRMYFEHLTAGNIEKIIGLFSNDGVVNSPFLGQMQAHLFFEKLSNASRESKLTVYDVLLGQNHTSAAAHFRYDWTLADGDALSFQGVDYFQFGLDGKFDAMSIFYDTHPIRQLVGDKYEDA